MEVAEGQLREIAAAERALGSQPRALKSVCPEHTCEYGLLTCMSLALLMLAYCPKSCIRLPPSPRVRWWVYYVQVPRYTPQVAVWDWGLGGTQQVRQGW